MFEQRQGSGQGQRVGWSESRPDLGSPSVLHSRFKRSTMVWVGPPPPSPKPKRKALWLVRPLSRFLATVFSTWTGGGRSTLVSLGWMPGPLQPASLPNLGHEMPLTSSTLPCIP